VRRTPAEGTRWAVAAVVAAGRCVGGAAVTRLFGGVGGVT